MKFNMLVHRGSPKDEKLWKSTSGQIRYGGRPANFQLSKSL